MRIFLAIAVGSALIACSGAPTYASLPSDPGRVVRIDMSDFAFSPATITVQPGEKITLSFRNIGGQEHEFMVGTEAMAGKGFMTDWLALAKAELPSRGHDAGHVGEGLRLAPRAAANVTLVVPQAAGRFEFACFVVGHYESGMKGTLIVEAGSAPGVVPTAAPTSNARATAAPTSMPGHTMDAEDAEQH
jgi:uncharacterized cupredoxin-like copper-binding protein